MKSKTKKCATGGDLSQFITPALSLIPGVGQFAPLVGTMLGALNEPMNNKQFMGPTASPGIKYNFGGIVDPPTVPMIMPRESTNVVMPPLSSIRQAPETHLSKEELMRERRHNTASARAARAVVRQELYRKENMISNPVLYAHKQLLMKDPTLGSFGGSAKAKSKDRFREKNYGGDISTSSNGFQVNGASNVTDGNYYPNANVKLDHNEVVSNNFVYSDAIANPSTGKTFAQNALPLEKLMGKLETKKDPISANTMKHTQKQLDGLKMFQEAVATSMGLRNELNQFKYGGPLPYEEFNVQDFQNWYNSTPANTPLEVDNIWGPQTQRAFNQFGKAYLADRQVPNMGQSPTDPNAFTGVPNRNILPQIGFMAGTTLAPEQITMPRAYDAAGVPTKETVTVDGDVMLRSKPLPGLPDSMKQFANQVVAPKNTITSPNSASQYEVPVTVGDALQAVEVGSKFAQLIGGPEQERANLDNTYLTRQSFDVAPQLYQSQRNLSNQINSVDTGNINLRRAIFNNAYANKLNNDSRIVEQYQNMNNAAATQYEDRVSNQRRFNVGQQNYTNDINARNRGQFDTLLDNAFTSLGNFGEGLNQKVYANDTMRLYEELYPQISKRVTNALSKDDLLKLLKLRNG